jgi:hypothetical protein
MTIIFSDNFDGEVEGTSPPVNWTNQTFETCEVDDVHSRSSPHSMYLRDTAGSGYCRHEEAAGLTTERLIIYAYFENTTVTRQLITQATTGVVDSAEILAQLSFDAGGDIRYYDGAWQDTGYNYTTGWHKIEIVHNLGANQFDAWYDDVKIINAGSVRNGGKASWKAMHLFLLATGNWWIDDVQIGEAAGWAGTFLGETNPPKVNGLTKENVSKVNGEASA